MANNCSVKRLGLYDVRSGSVQETKDQLRDSCLGSLESLDSFPDPSMRTADVVISCVPTSKDTRTAIEGWLAKFSSFSTPVWLDLTSGDPLEDKQMQTILSQKGTEFLDVGVSGGPAGARNGTLTAMVGGCSTAFESEHVQSVLSMICQNIFYIGPQSGSGHAVK